MSIYLSLYLSICAWSVVCCWLITEYGFHVCAGCVASLSAYLFFWCSRRNSPCVIHAEEEQRCSFPYYSLFPIPCTLLHTHIHTTTASQTPSTPRRKFFFSHTSLVSSRSCWASIASTIAVCACASCTVSPVVLLIPSPQGHLATRPTYTHKHQNDFPSRLPLAVASDPSRGPARPIPLSIVSEHDSQMGEGGEREFRHCNFCGSKTCPTCTSW